MRDFYKNLRFWMQCSLQFKIRSAHKMRRFCVNSSEFFNIICYTIFRNNSSIYKNAKLFAIIAGAPAEK